jgi:molybdopterin-guanine dinucleotide biosynthesis protein A
LAVNSAAPCTLPEIAGLILAGGKASRMGGTDKGLVLLNGRPMIEWVIDRLRPQVGSLILNTNTSEQRYADFGSPVVADTIGGYSGPLAGLHAGLAAATTPYVACVPCDAPLLPQDLVAHLYSALIDSDAEVAVARTARGLQPTFMLCRTDVAASIESFLSEQRRAIRQWLGRVRTVEVAFPDEATFANVNTPEDLQAIGQQLVV